MEEREQEEQKKQQEVINCTDVYECPCGLKRSVIYTLSLPLELKKNEPIDNIYQEILQLQEILP